MAGRPCAAQNRKGEPCQAPPQSERAYCFWHDPAQREARAQAQALGRQRQQQIRVLRQIYDLGDLKTPDGQLDLLTTLQFKALPLADSVQGVQALTGTIRAYPRIWEQAVLERRLRQLEEQDRRRPR